MEDARASAARIHEGQALEEPLESREGAARVLARLGEGERALALLPESASQEGRLARAELLLRLRREPDAARLLDAIGTGEGPGVRVHLLRAELHERRQEFEAAEAELEVVAAALAGSSDDAVPIDAGFTAGYLALGLGRPREARAFFRAARDEARTPSRKADALFDLSVAAAEDGELAEAEASLEESLSLFSSLGERDRYLTALGQRASLAVRRSDALAALGDLRTVLAHDRMQGRAFQLLFSIPLRQRLALADGDGADGAEAFAEALSRLEECAGHPAFREILVLEGARLLAGGAAAEALARLEEAEPRPDARSGVEPLRVRLVASARRDLNRTTLAPPKLDAPERTLLEAEERLARGLAPQPAARKALASLLDRPEGPIEVASRLLEWQGRFPSFFSQEEAAPLRQLGLRAARRAGLDGAAARFQALAASVARPEAGTAAPPVDSFVAEDAATREVFDTVRRVAPHRISVLVLGESGTGKELVAREVHRASGRGGPFVAVNVAALPETLAEAELFGAVRGAFTGADRDRPGVVEASSGGTLFLDEIGDLSSQVQAKLLRVLQEREVRRLGETRTRAVDLRLVAATHRDLSRLASEGSFRGDLLYRIAGITVCVPPLRERPRDLRVLLDRALAGTPIAPEARAALLSWSWPGNVRELLSAIEVARAMAGPGGRVERGHLPPRLRVVTATPAAGKGRYREAVDEAKRRVILETLAEAGGNRTRATALLGLSRQSLLYEMKRLSITD
jgi:DNA-binding NtrC family response regulator/tetratricopeptide (TPR) repeat protein